MAKLLFSVCVVFLIIGAYYKLATFSSPEHSAQANYSYDKKVSVGEVKLKVKISEDGASRQKGLSDTSFLCDGCGMLFVFEQAGFHSFWMKDMNYDLDILFFDKDKKLVEVHPNVNTSNFPDLTKNRIESQYVLEINSGKAQEYNIKIGDHLQY